MKPESPAPWLLFLFVLVSLLSGCASQPRYEAAVQVDAEGDVVCAFKVRN